MAETIYKEVIFSKDEKEICILKNGKTIDSRYNPVQSCLNSLINIDFNSSFFIVLGLSSGILCKLILDKNPEAKILVLEINKEDFDFLKQIELNRSLEENRNIIFSTLDNLEENIFKNYLPALHGLLQVIEQKPWMEINSNYLNTINSSINLSIKKISADYSVQAHFGKIWMNNILNNLKIHSKNSISTLQIDNTKTALIVAAGPSLDKNISKIKDNRNNYIIFSTDTAYQTLLKNNIVAEYLISIDGQNISCNHFYRIDKNTTVLMDLCGSFSILKKLQENNIKFYFFISGHPFCSLINEYLDNSYPLINNGSGTVTISALDIACKSGFNAIEVFGADFSFPNNKSYSKGTYLDSIYGRTASRISNTETLFDKLMYRTELSNTVDNIKTTETLKSYKNSFLQYLEENQLEYKYENFIYTIKNKNNFSKIYFKNDQFNYSKLLDQLLQTENNLLETSLLPLIAHFRKNDNNAQDFQSYCKLALSYIVSYN